MNVAVLIATVWCATAHAYCEGTISTKLPTSTNYTYLNTTFYKTCSDVLDMPEVVVPMKVRGGFVVDVLCVEGGAYLPLRRTGTQGNFAKAGGVETSVFDTQKREFVG